MTLAAIIPLGSAQATASSGKHWRRFQGDGDGDGKDMGMNEQAGPVIPFGAIPAHQKPQREINPTAPPMGTARQAVGQPLAQVGTRARQAQGEGHHQHQGEGRRSPAPQGSRRKKTALWAVWVASRWGQP